MATLNYSAWENNAPSQLYSTTWLIRSQRKEERKEEGVI